MVNDLVRRHSEQSSEQGCACDRKHVSDYKTMHAKDTSSLTASYYSMVVDVFARKNAQRLLLCSLILRVAASDLDRLRIRLVARPIIFWCKDFGLGI